MEGVQTILLRALPRFKMGSPVAYRTPIYDCIHRPSGSKYTVPEDDIAALTALVQRMVEESGAPVGFDSWAWLDQWLLELAPAIGHRRPLDVLSKPGGLDLVRSYLLRAQSGAFS